ncbi:hypothetical protein [Cedecea sp. P7760]|uniref:hypothetical protein n=1 Tax=Cedecea sp. P7760 TaxID=2726983 RepID=UPI0015A1B880|nr:hypothetical protein [Cedecea sp. P7760]NWC64013.1 hypothetical protein [Cedecea sp. P7760]
MNRSFLRSAWLCLAFISPLLIASCSSSDSKGPHATPAAGQLCTSCVDISVKVWKFTPDAGFDVAKLSGMTPASTEGKATVNMQAILKEDQPTEILKRLRKSGRVELVLYTHGITTTGQALPVNVSGGEGKFSAVLLPVALTTDAPDLIRFELNSDVPVGGFIHGAAVFSKGSFSIKEGDALLSLQKVREGYVVWLITTKNPV